MKRVISTILVCTLLLGCVFALASCGSGPSGKYKDAVLGIVELEFKGKEVTITVGNSSSTAEFEMGEDKDGDPTITFVYPDGEKSNDDFEGTVSYSEGEEDGKAYIKIGGVKYNKVD